MGVTTHWTALHATPKRKQDMSGVKPALSKKCSSKIRVEVRMRCGHDCCIKIINKDIPIPPSFMYVLHARYSSTKRYNHLMRVYEALSATLVRASVHINSFAYWECNACGDISAQFAHLNVAATSLEEIIGSGCIHLHQQLNVITAPTPRTNESSLQYLFWG